MNIYIYICICICNCSSDEIRYILEKTQAALTNIRLYACITRREKEIAQGAVELNTLVFWGYTASLDAYNNSIYPYIYAR